MLIVFSSVGFNIFQCVLFAECFRNMFGARLQRGNHVFGNVIVATTICSSSQASIALLCVIGVIATVREELCVACVQSMELRAFL